MILLTAEEILKDIGAEPLIVSPETTIREAVRLMLEKGNHAVLIAGDGNYLGIWTERDLMKNVILDGFDPTTTKVSEHMSFPLKAAHHTDDLFQLIAKFIDYDTRHLLIEKDGKYIGVLYAKDVMRVGFVERSKQLDELDDMVSFEFYENWKRKKRDR
jgi:signal-transduction protein with cAMP-binding, CBS, and nucleotidyltransferase domain